MLSAIKEIGDLIAENEFIERRPTEGKILSIVLDIEGPSYTGVDIEDFDSQKAGRYLFKPGASRGNAPSPFSTITDPSKTCSKLERWLGQCESKDIIEATFLRKVNETLKINKESIISSLTEKIKELPRKKSEGRFLTLKFKGERKYLGEFEIFKKSLEHFADTKRKRSASLGICSVCGIPDKEVSGKTDVFKFYTIDKPGFIAGGFKESLAWRNFPVCLDCKTSLENGRRLVENILNFRSYGLNYYLIPRSLVGGKNVLKEVLDILSDTTKAVSLKERTKKRITSDENEILEYLSEMRDVLTLNFLFLRRELGAERILLLIEDVFPSRIRKIFEAKDYVDGIFGEDFNFGKIRVFFSKSDEAKREYDLRNEFISDGYFSFRVKDGLMSILFFENLGLMTFEEESMEESMFDRIFTKFGKSLGGPAKRGIFLLGVLTQLLLNKQWSERSAKPFMKKLKGLKMGEDDLKALLPELQNKLEEYDSFDRGKRVIASETSKFLLEAGDGWKMSVDEMNFYKIRAKYLACKGGDESPRAAGTKSMI